MAAVASAEASPLLGALGALALQLVSMLGFCFGAFRLWSKPLRRRNRGVIFLEAVRYGCAGGVPLETILCRVGEGRFLSHRGFRRAAQSVRDQAPLEAAVRKLGSAVPDPVRGLLEGGVRLGDLRRVLPLGDHLLARQKSQTEAFSHYLYLMLFYWSFIVVASAINSLVMPKFAAIFGDMAGMGADAVYTPPPFQAVQWAYRGVVAVTLALIALAIAYEFGRRRVPPLVRAPVDRLLLLLCPWQRRRCRRDFALMLATCLDAGMSEAEALRAAARSTGNAWFARLADRAETELAGGAALTEVISRLFEPSGEVAWRLRSSQKGGACSAVEGWCGYVEAAAYRDEQAAAHLGSTLLLLVMSVFVGLVAYGTMAPLTSIIRRMALW